MKPAGNLAYAAAGTMAAAMITANVIVRPSLLIAGLTLVIVTGVAFLVGWMWEQRLDCGHHYWSTACVHLKHDECRRTCKFCEASCSCGCHWEAAR